MQFPNIDRFVNRAAAEGTSLDFYDNRFRLVDETDPTKKVAFSVAGVPASTTVNITVPGADATLAGTSSPTFTSPVLNNFTGKRNVLPSSGNTTLTLAMSGSLMLIDGATVAYTLPAVTGDDVGVWYEFFVSVASTGSGVIAQAADLLLGSLTITSDSVPTADAFQPDATDDLIVTMNGTTQGGKVGSRLLVECISATRWAVSGVLHGSGTVQTPFS